MGCCQSNLPPIFTRNELYNYACTHVKKYYKYTHNQCNNIRKIRPAFGNETMTVIGTNPFHKQSFRGKSSVLQHLKHNYPGETIHALIRDINYLEVKDDGYYYGKNDKYFIHKYAIPEKMINKIYELINGCGFQCTIGILKSDNGNYIVYMGELIDIGEY